MGATCSIGVPQPNRWRGRNDRDWSGLRGRISRVFGAALFVWAGLLLGVAFVATPAKFLAPSLPLAQALDVGRWTFHVLSIIEWSLVATFVAIVVVWRGVIANHWVAVLMCLLAIAAALAYRRRCAAAPRRPGAPNHAR